MTDQTLYNVAWTFGGPYPDLPDGTTVESSGADWVDGKTVGIQVQAGTPEQAVDAAEKALTIPGVNLNDVPVTIRNA